MKLAFKRGFYNGKFDGIYGVGIILKNLLSSIVHCDIAGIELCHVELVFSEEFDNVSFSSIEGEGSRFKDIKYSHPERWIFIDWDFSNEYRSEKDIYEFCDMLKGRKYDWWGIFGQAIGIKQLEDDKEFYCSEIVAFIKGIKDYHITPQKLYQLSI